MNSTNSASNSSMSLDKEDVPLTGVLAVLFGVGGRRAPAGLLGIYAKVLAILIALYVLYAATIAILDPLELTATFLSLMLALLFLVVSARREAGLQNPPLYDIALSCASLACGAYFVINADTIVTRISLLDPLSNLDLAAGTMMCLLTIEATRRTVGLGLTLIVIAMLSYNLWGHHIGGILGHGAISYHHFLDQTAFTTNGIFGDPIRVAATYAFLFVIFGTFLEMSGGSDFFFKIAAAVSGRRVGGPAKVAVFSSALFGMVSGSPTSDVVTTGSVTIPMMRRLGYPRSLAGAIEVAASTSGGILPPVMASAAFIMVEITGIPYLEIVKAAIIPAFLYLLGVFVQVHVLSQKLKLRPMDTKDIPTISATFRESGLFILPLVVLTTTLFLGYSISFVAIVATLSVLAVSVLRRRTRLGPIAIANVLATSTMRMVPVAAACAAAGLVVGGISMTGLSGKLGLGVFQIAGDSQLISLILAASIAILLGMGMPTPSAYIMAAVLAAPVLLQLGLPELSAHMFLLFFAVLSAMTPPVAVAAYAAASLAEANPLRIASRAVTLAAPAFLIPFFFAFSPELLGRGEWMEVVLATVSAAIGVSAIAVGVAGYFRSELTWWLRLLTIASALLLMSPGHKTDLIGLATLAMCIVLTLRPRRLT